VYLHWLSVVVVFEDMKDAADVTRPKASNE